MVWDRSSEIIQEETFLCLSVNDSYNMNMNNVNIADQLRNQYQPDKWMRKQKWWWSMFFGGHGKMLVNAYIAYKRFMEMNGKHPILLYEFQMNAILAKISRSQYGSHIQQHSFAVQGVIQMHLHGLQTPFAARGVALHLLHHHLLQDSQQRK